MVITVDYLKRTMRGEVTVPRSSVNKHMNRIFFITRFLGIHPFRDDFRKSPIWITYSVLLVIIIAGLTVYGTILTAIIVSPYIRDQSSVFLRLCMDRFQLCIVAFSACYSIMEMVLYKNLLKNIVKSLGSVDKCMQQIGLVTTHQFFGDTLSFLVRIGMVFALGPLFTNAYAHDDERIMIMYIIAYLLPLVIVAIVEFKHNALLHLIEHRFDVLRARVENMNKMNATMTLSLKSELELLVKVYTMLVEISTQINDIYGRQILIIVGTIFIIVTSSANFIIEDFISLVTQKKVDSYPEMFMHAYVALGRLFELWVIISACDGVVEKAKEFTTSLYELMIQDSSLVISKNKKLYLHISSHKEPLFTAYGFFSLDYSLFHSVIAAATTYLVILIQFSQK